MRAASRLVLIGAFGGAALGACGQGTGNDASNDERPIEIETLPPDDSTSVPDNANATDTEPATNAVTVIKGDAPYH